MLRDFFSKQFMRFLLAGGIAAVVNFAVGYSLAGLFPLHGDIAIGYLAGMAAAFFLFETQVFGQHAESRSRSVGIFVIVNLLGLLQTWVIYAALVEWLFPAIGWQVYPPLLARAIAIITPTLTSFVGHKYFTFRQ